MRGCLLAQTLCCGAGAAHCWLDGHVRRGERSLALRCESGLVKYCIVAAYETTVLLSISAFGFVGYDSSGFGCWIRAAGVVRRRQGSSV